MDKFKLRSGNKTSFKQMGSSPAKQKYDLSKATVTESKSAEFDRKGLVKDKVGPVAKKKKRSAWAIEMDMIRDDIYKRERAKTDSKVKKAYETLQTKKTKKDIKTKEFNTKMINTIKKMIEKGFTPTKMAEQIAVAKGGTSYYKNKGKMPKMDSKQQSSRGDTIPKMQGDVTPKSSPAKEKGKKESDEVFMARAKRQKKQAINKLTNKAKSEGLSGQEAIDAAKKQYKKNI